MTGRSLVFGLFVEVSTWLCTLSFPSRAIPVNEDVLEVELEDEVDQFLLDLFVGLIAVYTLVIAEEAQ